jgi:glycosyltransferase involved in cell wall biosynthesis
MVFLLIISVKMPKQKSKSSNKMKKLTVVIPALNEEKAIKRVLHSIPSEKLKKMGYATEVMVIDNGSKDKTRLLALSNGAKVIVQPVRGYGNAYKGGFANATGDIIATGDADLTYPFEDLPAFLDLLESRNLDFLNTDRLKNLQPDVMHWTHQFGNRFLTAICKIIYPGFPFNDSQSGMWIFKRSIWDKMHVKASGMPFSQELKIEAYRRGFRCDEIPITYRARVGEVKLQGIKDAVKNTIHLFVKKLGLMGF